MTSDATYQSSTKYQLDLFFDFIHTIRITLQPLRGFMKFFEFYFIKSLFQPNIILSQRHGNVKSEPRLPFSSLQSLNNSKQYIEIFLQKSS